MLKSLFNSKGKDNGGGNPALDDVLWKAAIGNDAAFVISLIERGADVNAINIWRQSPLHRAAMGGARETAITLIAHGARLDAQDTWGRTPLHWAAKFGYTDMVMTLIARGADLNMRDQNGATPLDMAEQEGPTKAGPIREAISLRHTRRVKRMAAAKNRRPVR